MSKEVPVEMIEQGRLQEVMEKEVALITTVISEYLGTEMIKEDAELLTYRTMPKQQGKIRVRMRYDGNIVGIIKKWYDKESDQVVLEFVKQYKKNYQ